MSLGLFDDLQRRRRYQALIGTTMDRILMRFSIAQLKVFYNLYVNPEPVNEAGKRPVEEISVLTIANDFMRGQQNDRKKMTEKIEQNISLAEIISYAKKIKVNVQDIVENFEEQKKGI